MEQLKGIISRTQPLTASVSLTTRSAKPVDDATGLALLTMMAEAQAAKPNQTLPEGTPDMYLQAWEEIVQRFGLTTFRDGLWKALRSSSFFPDPSEIEEQCIALVKDRNSRKALERIEAEEKAFRDSGEERTNVGALMRDALAKAGKLERPKVIPEPQMEVCPHCSGLLPVTSNIRFWTAKEIYEYAALKEEAERIADMNREANKAHAEKCSAEQLANLPATPVPDISEEVA